MEAKCAIHDRLKSLFPDFSFKSDFLYGPAGQTLMEHFRLNPYRILGAGEERFARLMRNGFPTIRRTSIERLWRDAESSAHNALSPRYAQVFEFQLLQLWEDLETALTRKLQTKQALENLYAEARALDPKLPTAQKGVITTVHLARIVAETGRLSDFATWRKLMRFAGVW